MVDIHVFLLLTSHRAGLIAVGVNCPQYRLFRWAEDVAVRNEQFVPFNRILLSGDFL